MSYMDENRWNGRSWDDETQRYLSDFFAQISPDAEFQALYPQLTDAEKGILDTLRQAQARA